MPAPRSFAEEIQQDFFHHTMEVEQLLIDIVREGRTELLTSERAFVAREIGWDDAEIKRQMRRVNNILRLQAIAGRPEDREAALIECQTSVDLLAKQGPKITEKIEKLRAELAGLERDASTSQKRCEAQSQAVQQLATLCPQHIIERVQQAVKAVEAGIGQTLRDAKVRHSELIAILNINNVFDRQEKHIEFSLRRSLPEAVRTVIDGPEDGHRTMRFFYSEQWPILKTECQREYSELSDRLHELEAEYSEAIGQAELPLNYYSDPQTQENE